MKPSYERQRRVRWPLPCTHAAGSFLTDAYKGDVRCVKEVSDVLARTFDREPMRESMDLPTMFGEVLNCQFCVY